MTFWYTVLMVIGTCSNNCFVFPAVQSNAVAIDHTDVYLSDWPLSKHTVHDAKYVTATLTPFSVMIVMSPVWTC